MQRSARKSLILLVALAGAGAASALLAAGSDNEDGRLPPARVGTYDSRFIAMADCGSERFEAHVRQLDEALKQAKQQGDAQAIKKADRAVWEFRHLTHRQGFGDWPVDDILKQYPEAVERVKKDAQVDVLLSKWDKKSLADYNDAAKVDVTVRLIDAMKPSESRRRKVIEWLRQANLKGRGPLEPKELERVLKAEAGEHYLPPPARPEASEQRPSEPRP